MTTRALRSALLLVCFVLPASSASAATFSVTTTGDGGGASTLRGALAAAKASPGADVVSVPAGTYQLAAGLGQLLADSTVTIQGAGARTTVIRAAANDRVMEIQGSVTLRGVTLTGGTKGSTGSLYGGGLLVTSGDATLDGVAVRDNTVSSQTNAYGGGIAVDGGTLTLLDSTVSGNQAVGRYDDAGSGSAVGGGIYTSAPTTIRRSTIAGNSTQNVGAGTFSYGGGLAASDATTVEHATLTNNTSTSYGSPTGFRMGGNVHVSSGAKLALSGSILAGGSANNGPDCYASGTVVEPARNLSQTFDCLGAGSIRGKDPKLGALADNGGGTDTRRPALDSPAHDAAASCGSRAADQRGNGLPAGAACDLGAVEVGARRGVTLQASKSAAAAGEDVTLVATVKSSGTDDAADETLTVELPAGVTATTASATLGTCTIGGPSVTCALGTLGRNAAATVVVTVRASGAAAAVTARRSGPVPDHDAADDAASVTIAGVTTATPGAPAAPDGDAPTGGGNAPADILAPRVSALKLAGRPTVRRGATLRLRLSEAATLRVRVERPARGRRAGVRCAAKGKGRPCTRFVAVLTRSVAAKAGAVTVRIPARRLRAGTARFTVVAVDAAGNRSQAVAVRGGVRRR